ncbi:MAG: ParB/RepB/Spo0J family partition protein [Gemmatimonadaceae bacterium]
MSKKRGYFSGAPGALRTVPGEREKPRRAADVDPEYVQTVLGKAKQAEEVEQQAAALVQPTTSPGEPRFESGLARRDPYSNIPRAETGFGLRMIPVAEVRDTPAQARRHYDPTALNELATSIKLAGLQQPVRVRAFGLNGTAPYQLEHGGRRSRAFRLLTDDPDQVVRERHTLIPAIVDDPSEITDSQAAIVTAMENAQREDLRPWEKARNVCDVRDQLRHDNQPAFDEIVGIIFGTGKGVISEYRRIGETITEDVLRAAGATVGTSGEIDWSLVHQLDKGPLLRAAKARPEQRGEVLARHVETLRGSKTRRPRVAMPGDNDVPHYTYQSLRDPEAFRTFQVKITKPVSRESYSLSEGRRFLETVEPLVSALTEIVSPESVVYRPTSPNMPGAYIVIKKPLSDLSQSERKDAVRELREMVRAIETAGAT